MNKTIIREFNHSKIFKIDNTIVEKQIKKRFFRRAFIHPLFKNIKFDSFPTYDENKQDYYDTQELVVTGKCKNIFEAYALYHK